MKSAVVTPQPQGSIDALVFELEHFQVIFTLLFLWRHRAHRNAPFRPYELLPLVGLLGRVLRSDLSFWKNDYRGLGSKEGMDDPVIG